MGQQAKARLRFALEAITSGLRFPYKIPAAEYQKLLGPTFSSRFLRPRKSAKARGKALHLRTRPSFRNITERSGLNRKLEEELRFSFVCRPNPPDIMARRETRTRRSQLLPPPSPPAHPLRRAPLTLCNS